MPLYKVTKTTTTYVFGKNDIDVLDIFSRMSPIYFQSETSTNLETVEDLKDVDRIPEYMPCGYIKKNGKLIPNPFNLKALAQHNSGLDSVFGTENIIVDTWEI